MNTLGIDIGGTKIYVARYNQDLELEAETTRPTAADTSRDQTLENLLEAINEIKNKDTKSLGISWAGFVDVKNGQIIKAPNVPHLDGFKLCDYLFNQTKLPTFIENDARAFTYGAQQKIAPASKMCLGLIIGTGVGGGLVLNNKIVHGANGYAGEVGHLIVQQKEVESWLAGPGIKTQLGLGSEVQFSEILPQKKQSLLPHLENNLSVFAQWLSGLVLSFDPDVIIIGGGTGRYFWQYFESEIMARTQAQLQNYPHNFKLHFYNQNNAGAAGAAALSHLQ
jgi:glucokinase